jgi:bifunctional non-homologous end joining protein LigD
MVGSPEGRISGRLWPCRGIVTTPRAGGERLFDPDARAPPPYRWVCRPLHPLAGSQTAVGARLGHEIKHDGYRLIVRRDGAAVRLSTRRGYDWTDRYPAIANAAAKLKARSFTMDGEAVVCGANGVAVFDALHRRGRISDAILQAFDLLEIDGVDYRPLPLSRRKDRLHTQS